MYGNGGLSDGHYELEVATEDDTCSTLWLTFVGLYESFVETHIRLMDDSV